MLNFVFFNKIESQPFFTYSVVVKFFRFTTQETIIITS